MKGLTPSDIVVFGVYMLLSVGVGVWFTRQQKSLRSYLLADQDMNYVVVAISVIAAFFSGISYLGIPAETFHNDLRIIWVLASFLIATPLTATLFLPLFYRMGLVSVNEYLEKRFDRRLRVLASALFIARATIWLAIAVYAPALVISAATGWAVWVSVLICGLSTTLYTSLGGMKAVLWTDTLQFVVLLLGVVVVIAAAGMLTPGGFAGAWQLAEEAGKTRVLDFSLGPMIRVTFWAALLGGVANNLVQMVTDQVAVQRYLTAKSLPEATRALWFKLWVTVPMVSLFYLTGTMLAGYYRAFPDRLPELTSKDALLPYFVVSTLPAPLPGLLMAAIFAATMSTVSAGINSLTGIVMVDFGRTRLAHHDAGETTAEAAGDAAREDPALAAAQVRQARLLTTGFGLLVTVLGCFAGLLGTLVEAPNRIFGLLGGPLLGVFFLGALSLTRRVGGTAALVGMAAGTLACLAAASSGVSFLWYAAIGAVTTFVLGGVASLALPRPSPVPAADAS